MFFFTICSTCPHESKHGIVINIASVELNWKTTSNRFEQPNLGLSGNPLYELNYSRPAGPACFWSHARRW